MPNNSPPSDRYSSYHSQCRELFSKNFLILRSNLEVLQRLLALELDILASKRGSLHQKVSALLKERSLLRSIQSSGLAQGSPPLSSAPEGDDEALAASPSTITSSSLSAQWKFAPGEELSTDTGAYTDPDPDGDVDVDESLETLKQKYRELVRSGSRLPPKRPSLKLPSLRQGPGQRQGQAHAHKREPERKQELERRRNTEQQRKRKGHERKKQSDGDGGRKRNPPRKSSSGDKASVYREIPGLRSAEGISQYLMARLDLDRINEGIREFNDKIKVKYEAKHLQHKRLRLSEAQREALAKNKKWEEYEEEGRLFLTSEDLKNSRWLKQDKKGRDLVTILKGRKWVEVVKVEKTCLYCVL